MIKICTRCIPHEYQDKTYGPYMRVHNRSHKKGEYTCTCTVCGTRQSYGKGEIQREQGEKEDA